MKKSDIGGTGYGDSHSWIRGGTKQVGSDWMNKGTFYACKCGAMFNHAYDITPNIFEAIKQSGVINKCPNTT